jgi:O-antigen/teichoic acid export membrane protein
MQTALVRSWLASIWSEFAQGAFARHASVLAVSNALRAGLNIIQGILVARWLGPESYGAAALVLGYPAVIYAVFGAKSTDVSVKYLTEFHVTGDIRRALAVGRLVYSVDLFTASVSCLVVIVSAPWAARTIAHLPHLAPLLIIAAIALIPRGFVNTSWATLVCLDRYPLIGLIEFATTTVRVVVVLTLVFFTREVMGVVWGTAIESVLVGLVYAATAHALARRAWGGSWLQGAWNDLVGRRREVLRFLMYTNLNTLIALVPQQLDVLLLGYLRSPVDVGYYKLAKSVTGLRAIVSGPLQWVGYSQLARLWGAGDPQGFRRLVRHLAIGIGVPLGIPALLAVLIAPSLVVRIAGDRYAPARVAIQLLMLEGSFWLVLFWLRPVYLTSGRVSSWSMWTAIHAAAFLVLAAPAILWDGFRGLAVVSLLLTIGFSLVVGSRALVRNARKPNHYLQ